MNFFEKKIFTPMSIIHVIYSMSIWTNIYAFLGWKTRFLALILVEKVNFESQYGYFRAKMVKLLRNSYQILHQIIRIDASEKF